MYIYIYRERERERENHAVMIKVNPLHLCCSGHLPFSTPLLHNVHQEYRVLDWSDTTDQQYDTSIVLFPSLTQVLQRALGLKVNRVIEEREIDG